MFCKTSNKGFFLGRVNKFNLGIMSISMRHGQEGNQDYWKIILKNYPIGNRYRGSYIGCFGAW